MNIEKYNRRKKGYHIVFLVLGICGRQQYTLKEEDILDLLAYLLSGGDQKHELFQK